ncbi:MAG: MFS transporter [Alphaproteobacteria bacterium]|nr:MFS transporter [Alphaproteobacteria bacterium]MCB9691746.1 MFS transporter [Alphaproteobacteria bacterium]
MKLWYVVTVGSLSLFPFLAVHLTRAGMTDGQATWTLAAFPLGTLVGGPLWAWAVDRSGLALVALRAGLLGSAVCVAALLTPLDVWMLPVFVVGFAFARSAIFPLADAATVHAVGAGYGVVRGVGSLGYIGGVLAVGAVRETLPSAPLALGLVLLLVSIGLSGRLPPIPHVEPAPGSLRLLLASRRRVLVLLVAFLNGLSITAYDHLFALHMERTGVSAGFTSVAIAWGVLVEVVVMVVGPNLLGRVRGEVLLVVAVASGIPRFALTAWSSDPRVVAALQGLHGLQFGLFWITSVDLLGRSAPDALRRSAQALLPAAGFGVAPLVVLLAGGAWLRTGTTSALFASLVVPALAATAAALFLALDRRAV